MQDARLTAVTSGLSSNFRNGARAIGKRIGLHTEPLNHGEVEVRERGFLVVHLLLIGLVIERRCFFGMTSKSDVLAVPKAHVAAAREDQRVVAREME